jgi:hypothetical protein
MEQKTNLYSITIPPSIRALENLSGILDKAIGHAGVKKGDAAHLLNDRLVFDQFPLIRQIQIACDNAKGTAGRIAGAEIPKFEDTEKTPEELKVRIEKTVAFLKTIKPDSVIGQEDREIEIYFMPGKQLPALEYVLTLALPNFYFHMVTAYSILRKNGVELGKSDFLGQLALQDVTPS